MTDATFWDKAAEKYAARPIDDMAAYEATLDRMRAHLSREDKVLEVGCGTGGTALALSDAAGMIVATDISPKMIEIAETKRDAAGADNVRFQTGVLGDNQFEPASFDAVMAFNLLHLIEDVPAALGDARALIKPGGLFISKTPCLAERSALIRLLVPVLRAFGKAPFVNFLTADDLEAMIAAAGFEIVERAYYSEKSRQRFIVARKI